MDVLRQARLVQGGGSPILLPNCVKVAPWTLESFIIRAKEIHRNKYDYSKIISEHIRGTQSKVPVICKICSYEWGACIHDHINHKTGCPKTS